MNQPFLPDQPGHGDPAAVVDLALRAYAAVVHLPVGTALDYPTASRHTSGDPLAEYLVIELTEGTQGRQESERFRAAADDIDLAIGALAHVRDQLREHGESDGCLPLAFDAPVPAGARPMRAAA